MAKSQLQQLKPGEQESGATGSYYQEEDQDDESDHPATPVRPHRRDNGRRNLTPTVTPQRAHIRQTSVPSSAQPYPATPTRTPSSSRPTSAASFYATPHSHKSGASSMPSTRPGTPTMRFAAVTPLGAAQPSSRLAHQGGLITTPTSSRRHPDVMSAYMPTPDSATAQRYNADPAGRDHQRALHPPQKQLFAESSSRKGSLSSDIYGITDLDAWTPLFNLEDSPMAELGLL